MVYYYCADNKKLNVDLIEAMSRRKQARPVRLLEDEEEEGDTGSTTLASTTTTTTTTTNLVTDIITDENNVSSLTPPPTSALTEPHGKSIYKLLIKNLFVFRRKKNNFFEIIIE